MILDAPDVEHFHFYDSGLDCDDPGKFNGRIISILTEQTLDDCGFSCKKTNACAYFTYIETSKICKLCTAPPSKDVSGGEFIISYKRLGNFNYKNYHILCKMLDFQMCF